MAKQKVVNYVSAYFDKEGKFGAWHVCHYGMGPPVITAGNGFFVPLGTQETWVDVPDDWTVVREQAMAALAKAETKLTADHQNALTQFRFLSNQLLGLAAPDVLDAVDKPPSHARDRSHCQGQGGAHETGYPLADDDDDIPF
jgi:hypothetical protein